MNSAEALLTREARISISVPWWACFFLACGKRKPLSDYEKLIERARKRGCGYWQVGRVFFLSTIKATPCTSVKKQPGVKRRPAIDTDFSESIYLSLYFFYSMSFNLNMTFLLFGEPKIVIIYQDKLSKQMPFQAIRSVILWKIWPRINKCTLRSSGYIKLLADTGFLAHLC